MPDQPRPTEHAEQGDEKFYTMPVTNPSLNPANLPQHAPSVEQEAARDSALHPLVDEALKQYEAENTRLRADLAQAWQQRDQYLEQRNQARREVARLNREIATFDRTAVPVPHDHVRIEGCYRCVWPDDEQLRASGQGE